MKRAPVSALTYSDMQCLSASARLLIASPGLELNYLSRGRNPTCRNEASREAPLSRLDSVALRGALYFAPDARDALCSMLPG